MSFETGHIGLNVTDLDRSNAFYTKLFGFDVLKESREEGKRFAFLGKDQKIVLTLWQQGSKGFGKESSGLHHLSFQVGSIDEVQKVVEKLKSMGAKVFYDGIVPHAEGAESGGVFFEDPDGIRLEIYTPTGASQYKVPANAPSCGFF
jgi:catechol 2,3-dioxygenase-like lactoylglutathione lyase family enzyme